MAKEFSISVQYFRSRYVIVYDNAQGHDEEFYTLIQAEFEKINIPNTKFVVGDFVNKNAFFGSKGSVKMIGIQSDDQKKFELWFRATVIGNMLVLRMFEGGLDYPHEGQTMAVDYVTALDWLGGHLFYRVIAKMDPGYKDNVSLFELKKIKSA